MSKNTQEQYHYTQNRELSWLRFDQRVLMEATDVSVPVLERLKFVSIFSSNLDEFFMVRVGSLFDLARMIADDKDSKTGWTPLEQIHHIYRSIPTLLALKRKTYNDVLKELAKSGIKDESVEKLEGNDLKEVSKFFKNEMLPIISPIIIGANHPVPHLVNKRLYAVTLLEDKKDHKAIGIVPMPENVSDFLLLSDGIRYVRTENILLRYLSKLFGSYSVKESCIISVTRNADISFDDEKFEDSEEDFRKQMKKLLKQRDHLAVVRLEISKEISGEFKDKLTSLVKVEARQVFVDSCPLNMHYVYKLIDKLPKELAQSLSYSIYKGRWPEDLVKEKSMISQVQQHDRLLFYPYDSVEPFLKLLNEASNDPKVLSIKITFYRLASSSKIAQALCRAAENGKEVLVLMELRARFDEENNLNWSKMLEESGCQVIYGTEGYKCHSKICLITLREHNKTNYITHIGTGNYNEKTNTMYTDLSFMSYDHTIGLDASKFFRNMLVNDLDGQYDKLCVSPFGIKKMILENIDEQITLKEEGYICIKANALTEREVIDKLVEASQNGVEIQLIIRGICCLLPQIAAYSDNVHVTSIVGRFLEHGRIYQFGKNDNAKLYISSADMMTRNLCRRVEIATPIEDKTIAEQLKWILQQQLSDSFKASMMLPDGSYYRKENQEKFDSQQYFMDHSFHTPYKEEKVKERLSQKIKRLFIRGEKQNGR